MNSGESLKIELQEISAKHSALQAEHETIKKELEKSIQGQSRAENNLRTEAKKFEDKLAEKDELIQKSEENIKELNAILAGEQNLSKLVHAEILGKCRSPPCHFSDSF